MPRRLTNSIGLCRVIGLCFLLLLGGSAFAAPKRVVRVGVFTHYPAIFWDTQAGVAKGFYVDMLQEVAAKENWELHFVPGTWAEGLDRVQKGELDLLTSVAVSPERERLLSFGKESSFTVWSLLYTPPEKPVQSILEIAGRRVGVMRGDMNGMNFRKLCDGFKIACTFEELDSFTDILNAVALGRLDAGITASTFGYAKEHEFKVKRSPVVVSPFDIHFATARDRNEDLRVALDAYLKVGKNDPNSGYQRAVDRWLFTRPGTSALPPWVVKAAIATLATLLLSWGGLLFFRKRVQLATQKILGLNADLERELLERKRKEELILNVASGVSSSTGDSFFQDLVRYLAKAASADCTFVSESFIKDGSAWMRTLAVFAEGPQTNFEYSRTGTPCERVMNGEICVFPAEVQTHFPSDLMLGEMAAEGYIGAPLQDSDGKLRGVLAVITRSPLKDPTEVATLLRIFSARASSELERRREEAGRLAMERQVLHTQKLESLGVLAGGIAHDFNNLLTAILGHLNVAQHKLAPESPAAPHLESMERIILRAADLTRQMLAYSGKGRFVIKSHSVNGVIQEMTHLMEVSISKKIALRLDLAPDLPTIEADAAQIQQVILNLVTNASDAIGDREGIIRITTQAQALDPNYLEQVFHGQQLAPGTFVVLEVSDTGCGMSPEVQARIFDPFFTTKATGRGLGLSAILGILRGHHAGLKIYSESGRGTTFRVFFPASSQPAAEAEPEPSPLGESLRGTVLLVDDEEMITTAVSAMLKSLGLEVIIAHDGQEALEVVQAKGPSIDLILMDLTMPRMDGRESFRAIHALDPKLPVILSSGYNEQASIQDFLGRGLAGFLQKPYTFKSLLEAIQGPLQRRTAQKPS